LFIWLKSPEVQSVIESKASGSTNQIELATSTIKNYLISIPPLEEQHRIVQKVEIIMTLIDQMEVELKRKVDLVEKMASV
jgi:type I restriction enzyme S subunit